MRWGRPQHRRDGRLVQVLYRAGDGPQYAVEAVLRYDSEALRAVAVRRALAAQRALLAANTDEPGRVHVALASAEPLGDDAAPLVVVFGPREGP